MLVGRPVAKGSLSRQFPAWQVELGKSPRMLLSVRPDLGHD
jgi:hypothetical protein